VAVSNLPPGVTARERISPELEQEAAALGLRYGSQAGRSVLDAIARQDAFAIKARVESALLDASLAHSHYYASPEIIGAIAGFVMRDRVAFDVTKAFAQK
jgi:hypothetical protein